MKVSYKKMLNNRILILILNYIHFTSSLEPVYVFSQVVSLPKGTKVVVDEEFINQAEEIIEKQEQQTIDIDKEENADHNSLRSLDISPLVSRSKTNPESFTMSFVLLGMGVLLLLGSLFLLGRLVWSKLTIARKQETDRNSMMRQKLMDLKESRTKIGLQNTYVSNSVMV